MNPILANQGRDPRLDFFRGSAMFIIYIAHCRGNFLWDYIPARYGISDAADMFVFLSGMAASIAFGGTFVRHGMLLGTVRILYRCWQLMVGHLGVFFVCAAVIVLGKWWFPGDYIALAQLQHFFNDTQSALIGLFTLTYVPHYFDILPVYIVVLAMVPLAMLLARLHPMAVIAASIALYAVAVSLNLNLPAHADDQPFWYFNPFAWQLIFFSGFVLGRGWIKVPLDSRALLGGSVVVLLLGLAISLPAVFTRLPVVDALRLWIADHSDKTNLDLLQYLHFLASAYVAVVLLRGREQVLLTPWLRPFVKCGQQALAIFLTGMVLSIVGSMAFDQAGNGAAMQLVVNGLSFGALFAVAYGVAWIKTTPWKQLPVPAVATLAAPAPRSTAEAGGATGRPLPAMRKAAS